jgi:nucleoside-diphosphate-sugar epimerase
VEVLVTGHQGYIGSVLVPQLQSAGYTVTGVDVGFYRDDRGSCDPDSLRSLRKDIRDLEVSDLAGHDAVIHLAALSNDPLGDLNPAWTDEVNYQASVRLAQLSKEAGVRRFLFSSSCSVYGQAGSDQLVAEGTPVHPLTSYAVSKIRTEVAVGRLADRSFSPVFLRNATAYGWSPSFRADLVLNNLACWAHTTGRIRILSDGTPWRPLVHVQDIAQAFLTILDAPLEVIHNQVVNIGVNDQNYRVRELAEIVRAAFPGASLTYAEGGGPDPRSYRVDFRKLHRLLPVYKSAWNAASGARQLAEIFPGIALQRREFTGPRYTRLAKLKQLLEAGRLDGNLRWVS